MKPEYDPDWLEYMKRHDLWEGFAKYKNMPKPNRMETIDKVHNILSKVITKTSKYTKGALMKYVRDKFKGPSAYKDVGKVASKIIKTATKNKWGKWQSATKNNYIRLRK